PIPVLPVYGTALASCGEIKKVCGSADSGKPGSSSHNWRSSSRSPSTRARLGALTPYCERELMGPKKAAMLGNQVSGTHTKKAAETKPPVTTSTVIAADEHATQTQT